MMRLLDLVLFWLLFGLTVVSCAMDDFDRATFLLVGLIAHTMRPDVQRRRYQSGDRDE